MKTLYVLFIFCVLVFGVQGQIFVEDFSSSDLYEVTMGGEGNDGKNDYFQRVTNDSIGISYLGTDGVFFAGQDLDDGGWKGSASPSQLMWRGIDIKGFMKLRFEGRFAERINGDGEIDRTDGIVIQYRIDNQDWEPLLVFANPDVRYNDVFCVDTDFDGIGDGDTISSVDGALVTLSKSFLVWGDSLALSFTASLNSGDEDFAIDDFKLFVEQVTKDCPLAKNLSTIHCVGHQLIFSKKQRYDVRVFAISGCLVYQGTANNGILDLPASLMGFYLVKVIGDNESGCKKLLIQ